MRMPDSYLCWAPAGEVPVSALPAANGSITFGSFNRVAKISSATAQTWARVLGSVAGSRLVIKGVQQTNPKVTAKIEDAFVAEGVDPQRIEWLQPAPDMNAHLAQYAQIDIGLDPFPYNGTTTTVEALSMGVPVVALAGNRFIAHVGESILQTMGMADWIAADVDEYVRIAAEKASDLNALARLRAELRPRLLGSPLCDAPRFARNFEAVLREMWRGYCSSQPGTAA